MWNLKLIGLSLAALAIAGAVAYHKITVANLRADAADARASEASCIASSQILQGNVDTLAGQVEQQNREIQALADKNRALKAEADNRAVAALRAGEKARAAIRANPNSGPTEMNRWLDLSFPR